MEAFFGKQYKLETSENFDDYMKALGINYWRIFSFMWSVAWKCRLHNCRCLIFAGVGLMTRTIGNNVSPTIELNKNGDEFSLKTTSTFKNTEIKFKLGQEFDEDTPDGRSVKSVITIDGNILKQVQAGADGGKNSTIDREFGPNEVKAVSWNFNISKILIYFGILSHFYLESVFFSWLPFTWL